MNYYHIDPVVVAFERMIKHYAILRMLDVASKLTSPTNISYFWFNDRPSPNIDRECTQLQYVPREYDSRYGSESAVVEESHFKDDDQVVFYMVLDYPLRFSCCNAKDFRKAYLNARTNIKIELPVNWIGNLPISWAKQVVERMGGIVGRDNFEFKYFSVNRCVPLITIQFKSLKALFEKLHIVDYNERSKGKCETIDGVLHVLDAKEECQLDFGVLPGIVNGHIKAYRNFLIYSSEYFYGIDNLGFDDLDWKHNKSFYQYKKRISSGFEEDVHNLKQFGGDNANLIIPPGSDCDYKVPYTYPDQNSYSDLIVEPGLIVSKIRRVNAGGELEEIWFDDFVEEAREIQDKDDPKYKDMLDIDELYIYDLYKRFHRFVDLEFLKQDWYDKPSWEMK